MGVEVVASEMSKKRNARALKRRACGGHGGSEWWHRNRWTWRGNGVWVLRGWGSGMMGARACVTTAQHEIARVRVAMEAAVTKDLHRRKRLERVTQRRAMPRKVEGVSKVLLGARQLAPVHSLHHKESAGAQLRMEQRDGD